MTGERIQRFDTRPHGEQIAKDADLLRTAQDAAAQRIGGAVAYEEHGIIPKTIVKGIRDVIEIERNEDKRTSVRTEKSSKMSKNELMKNIEELTKQMREASRKLEFEQAAFIRDKITELRIELDKKSGAKRIKK